MTLLQNRKQLLRFGQSLLDGSFIEEPPIVPPTSQPAVPAQGGAQAAITSPLETREDFLSFGQSLMAPSPVDVPPTETVTTIADYAMNIGREFTRGFATGVTDIPKGLALVALDIENAARSLVGAEPSDTDVQDYLLFQLGTAAQELVDQGIGEPDPRFKGDLSSDLASGFGQVGSFLIPGGAVGAGAKALSLGSKATKIATAISLATQGALVTGSQQFEEAKSVEGITDEQARQAARWGFLVGTTEAAGAPFKALKIIGRLEKASGGKFTKTFLGKAVKFVEGDMLTRGGKARLITRGAVDELAQELVQTVGENKIAQKIYDKERSLVDGIVRAGQVGGIIGGVVTAVAVLATGKRIRGVKAGEFIDQPPTPQEPTLTVEPEIQQPSAIKTEGARFARDNPEGTARLLKAATAAEKKFKGSNGPKVPTENDFAAEGKPGLSRKQRGQFIRDARAEMESVEAEPLKEAEPPSAKGVESSKPRKLTPERRQEIKENLEAREEIFTSPPKGPAGIVAYSDLLDAAKKAKSITGAFFKRFFTSAGELPDAAFQLKLRKDFKINRLMRQGMNTVRDFDRVAKKVYGGRNNMTPKQILAVDAVLKNEALPGTLPAMMRPVVATMRVEIDALSSELVSVGAIQGELVARISENLGIYVTRSYRVHDDPKWAKNVPLPIRNKAKAWLRSEDPDLSDIDAEALIDNLLYEGKAAESPIGILKRGLLGEKDISILKKRQDIPIELRLLFGEHKDARVNYTRSFMKTAYLVENHRFLRDVRDDGLGEFFFDKPTIKDGISYKVRLRPAPYTPLAPLDGLYTTPEIKRAFEEAMDPQQTGFLIRNYMRVNGTVKFSKTILSVMTHVRNVLGNTGFAIAQGHWRVWNVNKSVRATLASLGIADSTKWRAYFLKMSELGVVQESARAGELQDVIRDASKQTADEFLSANADKLKNKFLKSVTELYRAEDDVWKIFAFENEKARYQKAHPEWTLDQIEARAAQIVRNTYPTYSLIPQGIRKLRRFPLMGTFVSFPYEVLRTSAKTIQLISEEMKDSKTRGIAIQRLAGSTVAATGTWAIAALSRSLLGITKEDDEAAREFMPPWSYNSDILWLSKDRYIDVGYVDPYSYMKNPLKAFMRGGDWQSKVVDAAIEAGNPFFSEEILAGKLLDISRNKKPSGGRIYNPEDEFFQRSLDKLEHLYDAIEPGTLNRMRKFVKGIRGEVSPYGRKFDPKIEALAEFTGQRIITMDIKQSLLFRAKDTSRRLRDSTSIINRVARRRGKVSREEFLNAHRRYENARVKNIKEAGKVYQAAIRLGIPTVEVRREFRRSVSKEIMNEIVTGVVQKNSYASNLAFTATSPSASAEEKRRLKQQLRFLEISSPKATLLLAREYEWRTLKSTLLVPRSGTAFTREAFRKRLNKLRRALNAAGAK